MPAGVQSELSSIAAPLCPEPQPAPAAVAGVWEGGKRITVCPSPLSSPKYFPLHNAAETGEWHLLSIFFPTQLSQLSH